MKVYSLNRDGSFNAEFYRVLSAGKITDIQQQFDYENDIVLLEGVRA